MSLDMKEISFDYYFLFSNYETLDDFDNQELIVEEMNVLKFV